MQIHFSYLPDCLQAESQSFSGLYLVIILLEIKSSFHDL